MAGIYDYVSCIYAGKLCTIPVIRVCLGTNTIFWTYNIAVSSLFTAPMIVAIFLSFVGGMISDKVGSKKSLIFHLL